MHSLPPPVILPGCKKGKAKGRVRNTKRKRYAQESINIFTKFTYLMVYIQKEGGPERRNKAIRVQLAGLSERTLGINFFPIETPCFSAAGFGWRSCTFSNLKLL